ncbi:MAG: sugar-binding domain-containing protein [Verrucomicrobiota bacterium]
MNHEFSRYATLLLCISSLMGPQARGQEAGSPGRWELALSGEDWALASFEPGEGLRQRAFAEGFPIQQAIPAIVPGDVHWDLERAGKVPPIYYGTNSTQVGWVAGREWWYRKAFVVPAGWKGRDAWLRFEGVDYLSEVWLNGERLGRHGGQFTPFEFEVAGRLRPGETNLLVVLIHPAPESVCQAIASGAGEWPVMGAIRKAYPRWKCATNAGWDWGAKIITMGIWQDVRLIASDGARLSNLIVLPQLTAPYDHARLEIQLQAESPQSQAAELTAQVRCLTSTDLPILVTQAVSLAAAKGGRIAFEMTVPRPRLWWPNGYGPQHRYELVVEIRSAGADRILDRVATTFGIRDLQMLPNPDVPDNREYIDYTTDNPVTHSLPQPPPERRYLIQINGRRIFARGGNWLPCDLLYGRPRRAAYEHLIRLAAQANFNLFRVWGGGLIDRPLFFELCDRYGIMLFQEFPNAGVRLPETAEALAIADQETREVLPLLMNHPCIVRYGGGNEWYRNAQNSRQMAQLRRICHEVDPTRPYHDPDPECIAQRHGPHGYEFWQHYQTYNTGLPLTGGPDNPLEWTEYGASAASGMETLKRIIPADHLWPVRPDDAYWIWHKAFRAYGEDNWIASAQYLHLFGELPDLETTVRCSQFVQAEGLRYANESMRRKQWHRSACASWTYNEPWPNAAHGCVVEYYGKPKMAYYYAREAFEPVSVSAEYPSLVCRAETPFPLKLFAVSDREGVLRGCKLTATAVDVRGRNCGSRSWDVDLLPDTATAVGTFDLSVPKQFAASVVLVQLQLQDARGIELSLKTYTFGVTGQHQAVESSPLLVPAVSSDRRRNLALLPAARAAASSVISGFPIHQIAHLNNGWYGNEASWIAGADPSWAQIDLGSRYTISRVCLGNDHTKRAKDRGATAFRLLTAVEYDPDSGARTWQTVGKYEGEPLVGTRVFDFPPVKARWVRIEITGGAGVRIDEIEVYEAEPVSENQVPAAIAAAVRGKAPVTPAELVPREILRPLLTAPTTELAVEVIAGKRSDGGTTSTRICRARVSNRGSVPALFVNVDSEPTNPLACHAVDSYFTLLAGASREVELILTNEAGADASSRVVRLRAKAWNSAEVTARLGRKPETRSPKSETNPN